MLATTWLVGKGAVQATGAVTHTHGVLTLLANIRADTLQIELNTQAYRVMGEPQRLAERAEAIANREANLRKLKKLTADNPIQQQQWTALREVIDQRLEISRKSIELRDTQGAEAARLFILKAPLQETRVRTYQVLQEMEKVEHRLLSTRIEEEDRSRQDLILAGSVSAIFLTALLTGIYAFISLQFRRIETDQNLLSRSERKLATTLQSIGDAVIVTDSQGRITRLNPVAEQLSGWSFDQAQGQRVDEVFKIIHELTHEPASLLVHQGDDNGNPVIDGQALLLLPRDGNPLPVTHSSAPLRDALGQIDGVVMVLRDVTGMRQAQRLIEEQNEWLEQRVLERTRQLHETESHLQNVMTNVPIMVAYVNAEQRYVYVNRQYLERFAPDHSDITGLSVREILGEERYAIASPLIAKALAGEPQNYDWQPFAGIWQVINYLPKHDEQNRVIGYYVLGTDITERKKTQEKIETLNTELGVQVHMLERTSRALRTLSAGNHAVLHATTEQGLLQDMCQAIVHTGGYEAAVVWYPNSDASQTLRPVAEKGYRLDWTALSAMSLHHDSRNVISQALSTRTPALLEEHISTSVGDTSANYPVSHGYASCTTYPLLVQDEVIGVLAIYGQQPQTFDSSEIALLKETAANLSFGIATLRDRRNQQRSQTAINRLTRYDSLTGLPNEFHFAELLAKEIQHSKQHNQPLAVFQAHIEQLDEINDAFGFDYGDQALHEFAARLCIAAPASAVVARLRASDFAILLPNHPPLSALAVVQRIEGILANPFQLADVDLSLRATVGIALYPKHGLTAPDLLRHMDIAMHQAQKVGIEHALFDPVQKQTQSLRLTVAAELRNAISNQELCLHLQPKVEMATGRVCGAEGLVRWKHPQRGMVPPIEFIELAEETGLIRPLTEWVLDAGLSHIQSLTAKGHKLPVAINLSTRNLKDEYLLKRLLHLQPVPGEASCLLELEITETAVMDNAEFSLQVLHALSECGLQIYIDDFGTGYSSLGYLQKFPVNYIKIDKSFIHDMTTSKSSTSIVRSTIDLAHELKRKVVAEGVETLAQWEQLAAWGCDIAQGYFIGKPMPMDEFEHWLENFRPPTTT